MAGNDNALEQRVLDLLGHLNEMPAIEAGLPFTVGYLVGRVREVARVECREPAAPYVTSDS